MGDANAGEIAPVVVDSVAGRLVAGKNGIVVDLHTIRPADLDAGVRPGDDEVVPDRAIGHVRPAWPD